MSDDNLGLCAICHEDLNGEVYTLPECNHTYHINCIMTWFRTSKNGKCPLCNNQGVNKIKDLDSIHWSQRSAALENFKFVAAFARRKDAPKDLKKKIEKLKKIREEDKKFKEEFKKFKSTKHPELTAAQIYKQYMTHRKKKWANIRKIRRHKTLIGFQNIARTIIIPIKQEV